MTEAPIRISRPVGRADLEFYYGGIVLATAKALSRRPWDSLSDRRRQYWLDRAGHLLTEVLNTASVVESLPRLAENLRQRA